MMDDFGWYENHMKQPSFRLEILRIPGSEPGHASTGAEVSPSSCQGC